MNLATRLVAAAGLFRVDVHRADRPMAVSINRALGVVAVTVDAATRTGECHRVRGRVAGPLEAIIQLATTGEISGSQFRCPRKTMMLSSSLCNSGVLESGRRCVTCDVGDNCDNRLCCRFLLCFLTVEDDGWRQRMMLQFCSYKVVLVSLAPLVVTCQ